MNTSRVYTICAAAIALAAACTESTAPATPPRAFVVRPDSVRLVVNGSLPIVGLRLRSPGGYRVDSSATWTALGPLVATVTPAGVVTAVDTGTAIVVGSDSAGSDSTVVTVERPVFADISANNSGYTCATATTGRVFCWGVNDYGTFGTGSPVSAVRLPAGVYGASHIAAVHAADYQACALTTAGSALCWGAGRYGQYATDSSAAGLPTIVQGGPQFATIGAGAIHGCGLAADHAAWCWGSNEEGQLGVPAATASAAHPVPVATSLRFTTISVGFAHTCGLTADSLAYCWGGGVYGTIGDGADSARHAPTPVAGGHKFIAIAAGGVGTCALTAAGAAWCWGSNQYGELGDSTRTQRDAPVAVHGGITFDHIAMGWNLTCGLSSGAAFCWGNNLDGQVGDGTIEEFRGTPQPVSGGLTFAQVSPGGFHTCGLTTGAVAYCWGATVDTTSAAPVPVPGQP